MKLNIVALSALLSTPVAADGPPASGGPYDLERYTIDSGGGTASGGRYQLRATIGQHDAGSTLGGGTNQLRGGFWTSLAGGDGPIFKDGFE